MKINIRKGLFETNSSSVHVITISDYMDKRKIPKEIIFRLGEFGWKQKEYNRIEDRASYLYTAIRCLYAHEDGFPNSTTVEEEKYHEYLKYISDTLEEVGTLAVFEEPGSHWEYNEFQKKYVEEKQFFYIDHVKECEPFLNDLRNDKKKLLDYLLSGKSRVFTGNDNENDKMPCEYKAPKYYYKFSK